MKKLSIKGRVTLWYACWMLILLGAVLAAVFSVSDLLLYFTEKDLLVRAVEDSLGQVSLEDGEVDPGDMDFLQEGVYLSVYAGDGTPLYGRVPEDFNNQLPFSQGQLQEVEAETAEWLVYDGRTELDGWGSVWIRGVTAQERMSGAVQFVFGVVLIVLPFVVVLAAGAGYYITRRAFRPVTQIVEAAERIGSGSDLSLRIGLGDGDDEIHTLARAFDRMFDRLESSFEKEKQFTSDASHELRTPTAIILSQSEYALENASTLEEARKALEVDLQQAKKMSALLRQLLFLARADRGVQKLQPETIDLSEIAGLVAEELQGMAEKRQIRLETEAEPGLTARADETMMMRVFLNLLSNAVKYGKEGGFARLRLWREGGWIAGEVRDDGIGIAEENLPLIWNRFYQADPARTAEGGSGLGLSMVKWIIEAHGGSVGVSSRLGEGSVFTFRIPAGREEPPQHA